MEIEELIERLSDALSFATARTFHGCRNEDAGIYHTQGIRLNDPGVLSDEVRRIVMEEDRLDYLRPSIEKRLREFDSTERDTGRLYVVMDDRGLTDSAGHYALYGSEWILCVLGAEGHETLRKRGIPTILAIDLPLSMVNSQDRVQLAKTLLQEWTRIKANRPDFVPELDFTFCLSTDIPGEMIVSHTHPVEISDPFHLQTKRRTVVQTCPACQSVPALR